MDKQAIDFVNNNLRSLADRYSQLYNELCTILRQYDTQNIDSLLGTDGTVQISPDERPLVTVEMVKNLIAVMKAIKSANNENDGEFWKAFLKLAVNPRG
jgi:hypothetical protein